MSKWKYEETRPFAPVGRRYAKPMKERILIFGCNKSYVDIQTRRGKKFITLGRAKNRMEMSALLQRVMRDEDVVMYSSSMDFPKDYTSDEQILSVVRALQSKRYQLI